MSTLYRKYRPKNFKEVVGQNHIKIIIQNEIQTKKIAHAYLFCGPRAVGKTTLARIFSKSINCIKREEFDANPCCDCEFCNEIVQGRSFDIIEIDAASNTGVDNIRENIIAVARLAPSRCKYKVFIIDEVHMLSISAFNALLKIIEEPPINVIFILCTTESHKVPATIISRCQRFDFKRISIVDIVKKLIYITTKENIKIDKKILESIARRSEGYMRDAESLLGQIITISGKEITQEEVDLVLPRSDISEIIKLISYLNKKNSAKGVELINRLVDDGVNLIIFLGDLVEILRNMLLNKLNQGLSVNLGLEYGESIDAKISEVSDNLSIENIIKYIEKFVEARINTKDSFIVQLPFEIAIVEICLCKNLNLPNIQKIENNIQNLENVKNRSPLASDSDNNFKDNAIFLKWNEVLVAIKKYNHSLSFILRACKPKCINENIITLEFKYKIHKDRVDDIEIRQIIEKVFYEVYAKKLKINAIINDSLEINRTNLSEVSCIKKEFLNKKNDVKNDFAKSSSVESKQNVVDDILDTFGGKIVK